VGEWNAYEDMLRSEIRKREAALGPDHPDLAESLYNLANSCFFERNYEEVEGLYRRALTVREKAFGPDHPEVAESLNGLAKLCRAAGRFDEAEALLERAGAI
jgi:tetratricopeptide (TPR) repeat protein